MDAYDACKQNLLDAFTATPPKLTARYEWKLPKNCQEHTGFFSTDDEAADALALKNALHAKWNDAPSNEERIRLATWYVNDWGGVRGNAAKTIARYALETPETVMVSGIAGIASYSKVLTIRDPQKYAIYDARVALSLNAIQILASHRTALRFPMLPSRNKRIMEASLFIERVYEDKPTKDFYATYLSLLTQIAASVQTSISALEMLLFANAEILALQLLNQRP